MDVETYARKDEAGMPDYTNCPLGIDVSAWQGTINWNTAASRAKFAFIKGGQNLTPDTKFSDNWTNSRDKLPRASYWFYDWRPSGAKPEAQGSKMLQTVQPPGEIYPVMDYENPYGGWSPVPFPGRDASLDLIKRFYDAIEADKMLLYMNSSSLKTLLPFPSWLADICDLFIAAYPLIEQPKGTWRMVRNPAEIPSFWVPSTYGWPYTFWQFTPKLDGTLYGVGSLDLDGDLFNGTDAELRAYTGFGGLTLSEKVDRLWAEHPELHD